MGTPKQSPHLKSLRETGRRQGMYLNPRMGRSGDRLGEEAARHTCWVHLELTPSS